MLFFYEIKTFLLSGTYRRNFKIFIEYKYKVTEEI